MVRITLSGGCCCTVYIPHFSSVSQILFLFSSAKKLWFHCVDYTLHMKSTRKSPNFLGPLYFEAALVDAKTIASDKDLPVFQILSLFSSAKKLWFHCVDYTLHMKSTRKSPNRPTDPKSQQQKQACALSEVMVYRLWNFFLGGDCDRRCPIPADVKNESRLMILIRYS